MQLPDFFINLILSVIMIVGVYQFYFFTQRYTFVEVRTFHSRLDERVPFWPSWSWIYSFLYYPAILYINWLVEDSRHFTITAFSYIVLLIMQMGCFTLFPVATPAHWRSINAGQSWSERFLLFVQRFDAPSNCFPSMHVSVAMLTALLAMGALGPWVFLFPLLIALSCTFTKQHYLADLPAGAVLGWLAYQVYLLLI
ncbi:hypothetical protein A9179_06890 [Pseudomonas alcaligenes]|uniref:Inositolphosphotransferase Aur1/Ipt1 domain-containing protein n=1 Tax=Aquipseudomonas alcaligenes TaxID=43263 RepID=A0ABR7RXD8_AQUAC|nr:phosphatase PAP2 family protein [Pseudomonas alcaligenes]MBC9250001.1 hypothetical protein [Pseudomonas alcaligenes]